MATSTKFGTTAKAILLLALVTLAIGQPVAVAHAQSDVPPLPQIIPTTVWSQYAHLSKITVSVGQTVHKGDIIGYMGDTGYSGNLVHLHFEMSDLDPIEHGNVYPTQEYTHWLNPDPSIWRARDIPLGDPISGGLTQCSGSADFWQPNPSGAQTFHTGIDYCDSRGSETPILAVYDGIVDYADWWPKAWQGTGNGHGNLVAIRHDLSSVLTGQPTQQVKPINSTMYEFTTHAYNGDYGNKYQYNELSLIKTMMPGGSVTVLNGSTINCNQMFGSLSLDIEHGDANGYYVLKNFQNKDTPGAGACDVCSWLYYVTAMNGFNNHRTAQHPKIPDVPYEYSVAIWRDDSSTHASQNGWTDLSDEQNGWMTNNSGQDVVIRWEYDQSTQKVKMWVESYDKNSAQVISSNEAVASKVPDVTSTVSWDFRTTTFTVGGQTYVVALWIVGFGLLGLVVLMLASLLIKKKKWRGVRFVLSLVPNAVMIFSVLIVVGPPPYEVRLPPLPGQSSVQTQEITTQVVTNVSTQDAMIAWATQHGIGKDNLLANIAASNACWSDKTPGKLVTDGSEPCTQVDLLTLLSIDDTESTSGDTGNYDPTKPGVMGRTPVEQSARDRWGADAMSQLQPLWQILEQPGMRARYPGAITDVNGDGIYEPEQGDHINVYGSSATCIGRSQGLPSSIMTFAGYMVKDPNFTFDPWNDPLSSAMFKAAHLSWSYHGASLLERRRTAIMRYNPGAADLEWSIASARITQLGDIPTTMPEITTTVVKTTVTLDVPDNANQQLFHVLYSTWTARTPLEYLIAFARVQRGNKDVTPETSAFWAKVESVSCNISWGFAARPCWQEVNAQ